MYQEFTKKYKKLLNDFEGIFFAFSDKQFFESAKKLGINANKKEELKKIVSIGTGGYILKTKVKDFNEMFKKKDTEFKKLMKNESFAYDTFLYELRNHEYCITCDITDTLNSLGYAMEEIKKDKILSTSLIKAMEVAIHE